MGIHALQWELFTERVIAYIMYLLNCNSVQLLMRNMFSFYNFLSVWTYKS